ncbi:DUF4276 family protein [Caballeronia zhejiangensis]|uniref:DUF4276 family protein n=1 Tax=Caballeronia zhejiangensis TaxID=871203 RepID=A0A656QGJ8_9BURK|nr:DUF4276 family protein [Caballeronia zhejiangensis]EKS69116.1 hypothetical protein BURK_028860 [Burkholderia sp. SJ98]KDR29293.1 hypothetical protein BG60_08195 [Caballeronia zhejiangensis]
MIRVHVICEGQTEETFVAEVLAEAFAQKEIFLMPALIGKPGHKGGNLRFERLLTDVRNRLAGDRDAWCTTFFDYYGLPGGFPGKVAAETMRTTDDKAVCLLQAMTAELRRHLGDNHMRRFIPYVQMYEFEGLLFSHPERLADAIGQPALNQEFRRIRDAFDSPESINNSPMTAPSKRILNHFEGYDKPVYGSIAALEIGLAAIRNECPRFDEWLNRIEALAQ